MEELKQKYKDKPEKLNKATMDLYKKEKINPLGGCLPMLLQLPFFIAFFNVMPYLVDLRGVSFLWINNLANPDTLFTLPFWPNQFNLLPLIMAGVMATQTILQRKLQPASATGGAAGGNNMKILTLILPIVFLFITYGAPSGLTLYWTTSILFGIGQQMLFNYFTHKKKSKEEVEIIDSKGRKVNSKK
jgi:YidC/Oxa1 family membrane protein insertase